MTFNACPTISVAPPKSVIGKRALAGELSKSRALAQEFRNCFLIYTGAAIIMWSQVKYFNVRCLSRIRLNGTRELIALLRSTKKQSRVNCGLGQILKSPGNSCQRAKRAPVIYQVDNVEDELVREYREVCRHCD